MNVKRIIGLVLVLVGITGFFYANYQQGRIDVAGVDAQKKIDQGKGLFKGNPVAEAFGNSLAGSAEKDVASKIATYEQQVQLLRMGSIFVIVIGAVMVIFCSSRKKT